MNSKKALILGIILDVLVLGIFILIQSMLKTNLILKIGIAYILTNIIVMTYVKLIKLKLDNDSPYPLNVSSLIDDSGLKWRNLLLPLIGIDNINELISNYIWIYLEYKGYVIEYYNLKSNLDYKYREKLEKILLMSKNNKDSMDLFYNMLKTFKLVSEEAIYSENYWNYIKDVIDKYEESINLLSDNINKLNCEKLDKKLSGVYRALDELNKTYKEDKF